MKDHRHPHPHKDPRQPRDNTRPGTNPPVFAWLPVPDVQEYRLTVARDAAFSDLCVDELITDQPLYLPEQAFAPGRYYWRWSADAATGETFSFEIAPDAAVVEVPPADEWLRRLPASHPRLYIRPEDLEQLRQSRNDMRARQWAHLKATADELLDEEHEIAEPPFLPDRHADYEAWYKVWGGILWNSRRFVKGAEALALAWLAGGEEKYATAACERMASISRWDPDGSSYLAHNDEAHMSVIWDGTKVCDWVWDMFTDEQRELVIAQFKRRGEITYEHMHDQGSYGVTRFDSHAGREIVFLALIGFVFHEHIPEARQWLDWLRPVLCGIWPIWAGDDGAWAEGPSYGLAYVEIMTMFATALKTATGIDLYRRPFWANHGRWRKWCFPPYAEWMGFGDHTERWKSTWERNADLVDIIQRHTGADDLADYVAAFRCEAEQCETSPSRQMAQVSAQLYLAAPAPPVSSPEQPDADGLLRVFEDAGWAAIRTHLTDPSSDVAFIFRSSPYGAFSHSHANNNDFIIHVAGKVMAMPSGYYCGYGSAHHVHWNWHTKSHNCVTLSDCGQLIRSYDSLGTIQNIWEDENVAYMVGNADASYALAARCRRHVAWLKAHSCFVLIDELVTRPGVTASLQWNIHSWDRFDVDEEARSFLLEREHSTLAGHFLCHTNAFFSLTEGWDPPPSQVKDARQWANQYHLRFTPVGMPARHNLGVILCPGHQELQPAEVVTSREGGLETACLGDDRITIAPGEGTGCEGARPDAIAGMLLNGRCYEIGDWGIRPR